MLSQVLILFLAFITAVIGTVYYHKYKHTFLKYFIGFLWFTVFIEIFGHVQGFIITGSTFYIYNIYIFVSTVFYLLIYIRYLKRNLTGKILLILFILFSLINVLFIQKTIWISQTYPLLLGSLFISISVILFFIQLLNSDIILKINKLLIFWISIGLLLFYIGIIPIFVMADFFNYFGLFDYIILTLNVIMYGCFIFGFIVSKKSYNF